PMEVPSSPVPTMRTGPRSRWVTSGSWIGGWVGCCCLGRRPRECEDRAALYRTEFAHPPRAEGAEVQRAERAPHELDHRVPHVVEHAPHDAVAARVQRELDHRVALRGAADQPCGVGLDAAVLELEALQQLPDDALVDRAAHLRDVGL